MKRLENTFNRLFNQNQEEAKTDPTMRKQAEMISLLDEQLGFGPSKGRKK